MTPRRVLSDAKVFPEKWISLMVVGTPSADGEHCLHGRGVVTGNEARRDGGVRVSLVQVNGLHRLDVRLQPALVRKVALLQKDLVGDVAGANGGVSLHLDGDDGRALLHLELDDHGRLGVVSGQGVRLDGLEIVHCVQLGLDVHQERVDGEGLPDVGLQDRVEVALLDRDQPGERETLDRAC